MSEPLISCVMPTSGRPRFIGQAIRQFMAQRYPNKELLIVYDRDSDLPEALGLPEQVRVIRSAGNSIGAKRNEGCRHAAGELVAQWDDDDLYHPDRLTRQAEPILAGRADITALTDILFWEEDTGHCWSCSPELFAMLFSHRVTGGTLVFRRSLWQTKVRYPPVSLREDAEFLQRALRFGARLTPVPGRELFVYRRHARNTWRFPTGKFLKPSDWKRESLPDWVPDFCRPEPAPILRSAPLPEKPLVSCIMPTSNRAGFVTQALRYFLAQDYPHKELIILDDGSESVAQLIPRHPNIRYIRKNAKSPIGAKRNEACRMAKGEIIVHWDDDDWYAPDWISRQVVCLHETGADVCGLANVLFYDRRIDKAWKYVYDGSPAWVAGATLAYRRETWLAHPFDEIQIGEDNAFVWKSGGKVAAHDHLRGFVSFIHPGNTSPKHTQNRRWRDFPVEEVRDILAASGAGR